MSTEVEIARERVPLDGAMPFLYAVQRDIVKKEEALQRSVSEHLRTSKTGLPAPLLVLVSEYAATDDDEIKRLRLELAFWDQRAPVEAFSI